MNPATGDSESLLLLPIERAECGFQLVVVGYAVVRVQVLFSGYPAGVVGARLGPLPFQPSQLVAS